MVIKVEFAKDFEHRFRAAAMKKYGYSKGAIKKASEEAVKKWMREESADLPRKDPIQLLDSLAGSMKHFRGTITSVDLQHEAAKLWKK